MGIVVKYMQCTTCSSTVEINNTGICLQCQKGSSQRQKDHIYNSYEFNICLSELEFKNKYKPNKEKK